MNSWLLPVLRGPKWTCLATSSFVYALSLLVFERRAAKLPVFELKYMDYKGITGYALA